MSTQNAFNLPGLLPAELVRALERAIVFFELQPGERLREEEVALRYGVSRSPVREAFQVLEQSGLLVREARRGVVVTPIARADFDEVYTCRIVLEGLAAQEAAGACDAADAERLGHAVRALRKAADANDARAYFDSNVELTTCVHAICKNATLTRLLDGIGKQSLRYRFLAYSRVPELIQHSLTGNDDMVESVIAGRGKQARSITERMTRRSWKTLRPHIPND